MRSDLISRQAAVNICDDAIDLLDGQKGTGSLMAVRSEIANLPSADPERCEDCGNFNKTMLLIPQPERQMEGNLENVESPRLATYDPEECKQKSKLNADGLISRQDAMAYPLSWDHYDKKHGNRHFIAGIESYREYIEALPSVEPEWDEMLVICDNCGHAIHVKRVDIQKDVIGAEQI